MAEVTAITDLLDEFKALGYRRWHEFGPVQGPRILWRRLMNRRPRPVFRTHMMWQRARRGWSDEDAWGFHYYLAKVIAGGVSHMREIAHGWPGDPMTYEEWMQILDEIVAGMNAVITMEEGPKYEKGDDASDYKRYIEKARAYEAEWREHGEAQFELAMDHLKKWFHHLWD